MKSFSSVQEKLRHIRARLGENSFDCLVWIVNIGPGLVGFDITRKSVAKPFWILHLFLLAYVYGAGTVVYQAKHAEVASDYIKSYVNVSILALTANDSYWFLKHRERLKSVLRKAKESDNCTVNAGLFVDKHKRLLSLIKRILLIFYAITLTNQFTAYLPKRADLNEKTFSMTPCVGLDLTSSPMREICIAMLSMQELSIATVVLNFQTTMLLLIGHTAVIYLLLADEIMDFNTLLTDASNYDLLKDRLIMKSFSGVQRNLRRTWARLWENSFGSLVWIINLGPSLVGFNITRKCIAKPFWIVHLFLLTYVYGAGSVVYQLRHAELARDFIKSYVNVSILVLTANNSYWLLRHRELLKSVLRKSKKSDNFTLRAGLFDDKHKHLLSLIKRIMFVFYGFNLTELTWYLPDRADLNEETFSMTPCVGLEPLTSFPKREICIAMLSIQELTIVIVVLNFETTMLFLIGHTAIMYLLLSDEIMNFNTLLKDPSNYDFVKDRLSVIIYRHALILDITRNLRALYSIPMGINFGSNAVCMCFFFFLILEECLNFRPIAAYSFIVFFLYCFLGQRLTNAAEVFERAVYSCGWEMMEVKEQKAIFTMLIQSQKMVDLLAADLIPVKLRTFARTCQGIYNFTTVVKV